ncbi:MAG: hypothetical protein NT069_03660 [Planctomycetota bacterium]|nr:hypothetical protein [Planctomycetota bacterium]
MAEIAIKIGSSAGYEDGDIVDAFSTRRIRAAHAEMLCHPWQQRPTKHGLRPGNHCQSWFDLTHQYRFERVHRNWVTRIEIATGVQEIFGRLPNAAGEAIDVDLFVRRRLAEVAPGGGPRRAMFGKLGREVWYGGTVDTSHARLNSVWQSIEAHTGISQDSDRKYQLWPFGRCDIREFLCVRTEAFEDSESDGLVRSAYGRRGCGVDWRALLPDLGATLSQALDHTVPIGRDIRESSGRCRHESAPQPLQSLASIVRSKSGADLPWHLSSVAFPELCEVL